MKNIIFILEDQYAKSIAKGILNQSKDIVLPIQENMENPLNFLEDIIKNYEESIILLDNYFPGKGWEEPRGNEFLLELIKTKKNYKIICISDRGERLTEWYDGWKEANERGWILGWIQNKNSEDILKCIREKYFSL